MIILILILLILHIRSTLFNQKCFTFSIPPQTKVFLSQSIQQVIHTNIHRSMPFDLFVHKDLNQNQHYHNYRTQHAVQNKRCNKQTVWHQKRIVNVVNILLVYWLNNRSQTWSSQQTYSYLEKRPRRSRRNHSSHQIDKANVSGHDQSGRTYLLSSHLIDAGRSTV